MSISRRCVILLNAINTLIAFSIIGVGIWLWFFSYPMLVVFGAYTIRLIGQIMVGVGSFFLFTIIIGCLSSFSKNRKAAILFCVLIVVHMIAFFSFGGAIDYYKYSLADMTAEKIDSNIQAEYGFEETFTLSINTLQTDMECCGGSSYRIYKNSKWSEQGGTPLAPKSGSVPDSCCLNPSFGGVNGCDPEMDTAYTTGCYENMRGAMLQTLIVASIVMLVFGGWLLLLCLVSCSACCGLKRTSVLI